MIGEYKQYDVVSIPEDGKVVMVYKDSFWWCVDGDPKKALFFHRTSRDKVGSPQCNSDRRVCVMVGTHITQSFETAQLVQIPVAYCPWED